MTLCRTCTRPSRKKSLGVSSPLPGPSPTAFADDAVSSVGTRGSRVACCDRHIQVALSSAAAAGAGTSDRHGWTSVNIRVRPDAAGRQVSQVFARIPSSSSGGPPLFVVFVVAGVQLSRVQLLPHCSLSNVRGACL